MSRETEQLYRFIGKKPTTDSPSWDDVMEAVNKIESINQYYLEYNPKNGMFERMSDGEHIVTEDGKTYSFVISSSYVYVIEDDGTYTSYIEGFDMKESVIRAISNLLQDISL